MRKQTKIAAIVSAAALLAIGASMTSFAAGWVGSGTEWEYQDRDGNAIEEEGWHRGESTWAPENAQSYYFADENGRMVFDSLIEFNNATYYVDSYGRRVTNAWVQVELEESYPMADESVVYDAVYYYFGSTGKAVHSRVADEGNQYEAYILPKDNGVAETGKFVFDENGVMQIGYVETVIDTNGKPGTMYCARPDDKYYITLSDGTAWNYVTGECLTGWARMDVETMIQESTIATEGYDDEAWFYFDGNKLLKAGDGDIKLKNIKGVYYAFDDHGVLKEGNVDVTRATPSDAPYYHSEYKVYVNAEGESEYGNQWVNYSGEDWYYIVNIRDKKGKEIQSNVIFNSDKDNKASRMIGNGGKRFMLGPDGTMITNAYEITAADVEAWKADAIAAGNGYSEKGFNLEWDGTAYWNNIRYIIPTVEKPVKEGEKEVMKREIAEEGTWLYFNDTHDRDGDRGEQEVGKKTYTDDDGNTFTRFFTSNGAVDGLAIYGEYLYKDGLLVTALDGDSYAAISVKDNVGGDQTEFKRYTIKSNRPSGSEPLLEREVDDNDISDYNGKYVIVDSKGKVRRSSSSSQGLQIDTGRRYRIENYIATEIFSKD